LSTVYSYHLHPSDWLCEAIKRKIPSRGEKATENTGLEDIVDQLFSTLLLFSFFPYNDTSLLIYHPDSVDLFRLQGKERFTRGFLRYRQRRWSSAPLDVGKNRQAESEKAEEKIPFHIC